MRETVNPTPPNKGTTLVVLGYDYLFNENMALDFDNRRADKLVIH